MEAESTEVGLAGLPGGREGKDARDKGRSRTQMGGTSSQIHLGGCGRTAQSQHCRRAKEEAAGFDERQCCTL